MINFYAPWCPWCQRLEPTWEAVTQEVHRRYSEEDGRIRFAKVDCTVEVQLCREHQITGFPSIRVFRKGHDEINVHGVQDHESYRGDRTRESLLQFADNLVPSAGQPHHYIRCALLAASIESFTIMRNHKNIVNNWHVLHQDDSPLHMKIYRWWPA